MRLPLICSIVLCLPLAFLASPTQAQMPLRVQGDIRVNVTTNSSQPITAAQSGSVAQMQADARKNVYELAAQECKLLLATIASECTLESLNVNSMQQSQYNRGESSPVLVTTSTAGFRIRPKN
ncbi:MAG TPA: hypothetical protein VL492_12145 [Methylovirgula sp.]|jgi:hypothetical protein|nr:hypothetical protein [Methylovirgula sp.]